MSRQNITREKEKKLEFFGKCRELSGIALSASAFTVRDWDKSDRCDLDWEMIFGKHNLSCNPPRHSSLLFWTWPLPSRAFSLPFPSPRKDITPVHVAAQPDSKNKITIPTRRMRTAKTDTVVRHGGKDWHGSSSVWRLLVGKSFGGTGCWLSLGLLFSGARSCVEVTTVVSVVVNCSSTPLQRNVVGGLWTSCRLLVSSRLSTRWLNLLGQTFIRRRGSRQQ
ncbi:hypothetical protein B0H16DRAFT_1487944 [Mycena metata]|uniref:Uncharacterized protein n=1 Tax=Mycena metata TaxID=1033252 RepID=A0AAD7KHB1_9AGAR|nr:hypothetical protein B0H16DRAFT_1487944 [Mycena metata]